MESSNSSKVWLNTNQNNAANQMAVVAGWIEAIGTIISAIGSTPTNVFTETTLNDFNLIGNILQACGSALMAETEDSLLDLVGDELQALGNITVVAGILNPNPHSSDLLNTQGNLLQILGSSISLDTAGNLSLTDTLDNIGNLIQIIGNTIQVFANTNTEEGVVLNATGSWIQAAGAVITAIASDYSGT